MQPDPQVQSYLVAAGLVVAGIFGVVAVWKLTKSLLKLVFWFLALVAVATVVWWLLEREGLAPRLPPPAPTRTVPAKQVAAAVARARFPPFPWG